MNLKVKATATPVEWKKRAPVDPLVQPLYSSVIIGDGALGCQGLFASPLGQPIPAITGPGVPGSLVSRTHDERTTNMQKAGEIGSGIGDALLKGLSYDFPDGCPAEHQLLLEQRLVVTLKIGGKILFRAAITELPVLFSPPIPLARNDSIQLVADVGMYTPLKLVRYCTNAEPIPVPIQPKWRRTLGEILGIPEPSPTFKYTQREVPAAVLVRFTFDATVTPDPR